MFPGHYFVEYMGTWDTGRLGTLSFNGKERIEVRSIGKKKSRPKNHWFDYTILTEHGFKQLTLLSHIPQLPKLTQVKLKHSIR